MKKAAFIISLVASTLLFGINESIAQFVVKVRPVAPVVVKVRPPAPRANWVWIDGFWRWHRARREYVWADGYWVKPRRGNVWIPGYWRDVPEGSIWVEGRWGRR
jgi:hypothetical protein